MKGWRLLAVVVVAAAAAAVIQTWLRSRHPALDKTRDYSSLRTNRWGTKALRQMCTTLGFRARPWRRPLTDLPEDTSVVVMVAPGDPLVDGELQALARWVRGGGTLIVAAMPTRLVAYTRDGPRLTAAVALAAWLGAVFDVKPESEGTGVVAVGANPWPAYRVRRLATSDPAEVKYVGTRNAVRRYLQARLAFDEVLADLPPVAGATVAGRLTTDRGTIAAAFRVGKGMVALFGDPDIFANGWIGRADNALLAAAVIFPRARGLIILDEYHHGLARTVSERPRPTASRLTATIALFLGALALYLVLGGLRMGRPHVLRPHPRRSVGEYVQAVAWLYQRAGLRAAALALLERSLRRAAAVRLGLSADAPAAQFAEAARRRGLPLADRLGKILEACQSARAADRLTRQQFVALARQLTQLRGEIASYGH